MYRVRKQISLMRGKTALTEHTEIDNNANIITRNGIL